MTDDTNTVTTSDFLDLIQADTTSPHNTAHGTNRKQRNLDERKYKSDTDARYSSSGTESRSRSSVEEDEDGRFDGSEVGMHHRQKMPLHGGYGGMFEAGAGQLKNNKPSDDHSEEDCTTLSETNASTISTAFTLASTWFSRYTGGSMMSAKGKNGASPSQHIISGCHSNADTSFNCSRSWGILLASLNYFVTVEDGRPYSLSSSVLEGGGASPDKIPSLHLRKPFQFLHSDMHANELLEKAKDKLQYSTRIGTDGPFTYDKVFPPKGTVAYVLPVTTCYNPLDNSNAEMANLYPDSPNHPTDEDSFRDFAIMLRAMVHAHSYQNPASGSMYDYKMHALIHPDAKKCSDKKGNVADRSLVLQNLGYQVSIQRPQINPENIERSENLKKYFTQHADNLSDLIRLNAYELEEYDAVVLVDYDTLILGSVDEAIDLINDNRKDKDDSVDAVFSWKHVSSFGHPQLRASVVNLSFFILRPSKERYVKLRRAIKESQFSEVKGWGSIGRGRFPGWMTTQGFLTYYYDEVENAAKVEMNRCTVGNTGESYSSKHAKNSDSSPLELITNAGKVNCGSDQGQSTNQCQDCSKSDLEDVLVADFSYCLAPWKCGMGGATSSSSSSLADTLSSSLCRKFQKQWFSARLQMEDVHPQLQKSSGNICVGGEYQPMKIIEH
ncbi:hypothetical protein HJC23_011906 [Cyclotella cryptica]|uniref:Nucleotide-diphospho-sugar transferase n=1 Tax=Cyclotella cryptica TaxID=29204 RepID=A0ABD3PJN8_9STRA